MDFEGQSVLVTGAASGIGRATAVAFASEGADLVLADVAGLDNTMQEIGSLGRTATAVHCDVSNAQSVANLFDQIDALHAVAHCAGVLMECAITMMSVQDFDQQIAVNLRGSFLIAQGAVRAMQNHHGRIVLVASELAHQGRAEASAYCASKAGVIGLTRALARECAPNILVNSVAPGPIDTPMLDVPNMSEDELAAELANPLGRLGRPEEIAAAILFLCGPGGTLMTGQTICPSGGAVML